MNEYCDIAPSYSMVDEILELVPQQRIHGLKNISFTELNTLYSDIKINQKAIFPQSLLIEVFTQFFVTALCAESNLKYSSTRLFECRAEFFRPCYVGNQLEVFAEININRQGIFIGTSKGYVEKNLIGSARFKVVVPDIWNNFLNKGDVSGVAAVNA